MKNILKPLKWIGEWLFIIFVLLLLFRTTNHAKGQVFILYAVLYSISRFFLEDLRGDYGTLAFGLKSAQLTSLTVVIIGILCFIWCGWRGQRINEK